MNTSMTTAQRHDVIASARAEFEEIVAKARVNKALHSKPPPCTQYDIQPNQNVYVYRERLKLWDGPFEVATVHKKDVVFKVGKELKPFNLSQVKPAETGAAPILWTEIIPKGDPRQDDPRMREAVRIELEGLIDRGTFKIVVMKDPQDKNVVPTKFVLAIKHENGQDRFKARFCMGGHRDRMRRKMVHTSATMSHSSLRLVLALAAIFDFDVWTEDINQAYLQSATKLKRKIFCRSDELTLGRDEFLKLMLPLYGITEAGDYWGETQADHHILELRFKQAATDQALFFKKLGRKLVGLLATYVDDLLQAAPRELRDGMQKALRSRFDCNESQDPPTSFTGLDVWRSRQSLFASMKDYTSRLECLKDNATYDEYASLRAKLLWIVHVRPDIAAFVSMVGSVSQATFQPALVGEMNERIAYLKKSQEIALVFSRLDLDSVYLTVYADASFGNRDDGSSQIGYIICLTDASGKSSVLDFRSCKSWRVARSSMAAETLAFAQAFYAAFTIRAELSHMIERHVHLIMYTDFKALFETLTRSKRTAEGRLMIDIYAVREAYKKREIDNIALIRSEHNIADSLTKRAPNQSLLEFLRTHSLSHPVEQFIVS